VTNVSAICRVREITDMLVVAGLGLVEITDMLVVAGLGLVGPARAYGRDH
jgi:hypothetical protein